jgi:hypothetical protein
MARQSGKQLEQLVNDILDLRKLEQGRSGNMHPKPTESACYSFGTYCDPVRVFGRAEASIGFLCGFAACGQRTANVA